MATKHTLSILLIISNLLFLNSCSRNQQIPLTEKDMSAYLMIYFKDYTHGEYAEYPRHVGNEESKKLFMWVSPGVYDISPNERNDNTHLNIYGGKIIAGIAIEAVAKVILELAPYMRYQYPPLEEKYK